MTSKAQHRAIVRITLTGKQAANRNYSRRMYAIVRRYTPNGAEGGVNECFAELTGLRTFFKMTYTELAEDIRKNIMTEIGMPCTVRIATVTEFENATTPSKKTKSISTYREMNKLFAGKSFVEASNRAVMRSTKTIKKIRLTVPFLGKVA